MQIEASNFQVKFFVFYDKHGNLYRESVRFHSKICIQSSKWTNFQSKIKKGFTSDKNLPSFFTGTQSLVQNLLAYPGLGHSGPLDLEGGGSSGGECPSVCTSSGGPQVSSLPPSLRVRLYELFVQIEQEFEVLYAENTTLQVNNGKCT